MEYIDKLINEEESTQENVHRVVSNEESKEDRNKRIMIANEILVLNNRIKAVRDYLMKHYEPKIEYSGVFASQGALDIINLIQSIK